MTTKSKLIALIESVQSIDDFPKIDQLIHEISQSFEKGKISRPDIDVINKSFGSEFLNNTIQGYGLMKPLGYAGDYKIIDMIYTFHKSPIQKYGIWDEYFHLQSAPKAVRNRKDYFKTLIREKRKLSKNIQLLNVASGPARDIYEIYEENCKDNLHTTCIEMDSNAIKYAVELNSKYSDLIKFIHTNIFKHRELEKYDLIWSAGLFDYFSDKAFVKLISRFKNWLKEDGEIVIGNFNEDHNPSRNYMELIGDWHLIHRTKSDLIDLAIQAGFNESSIFIGREPENVNLFLHLKL